MPFSHPSIDTLTIDLSRWQSFSEKDYAVVNKARGVILKLGQGSGLDKAFEKHLAALNNVVGVYTYFTTQSTTEEKRSLLESQKHELVARGLRLWLDVEERSVSVAEFSKQFREYLQVVVDITPNYGIYSGTPFLNANLDLETKSLIACAPHWIAAYGNPPSPGKFGVPGYTSKKYVVLHQYSDKYPVNGQGVDVSVSMDNGVVV
jgi:GH25 family lysozyme M1 (1,4-beta-N-acetylmuramidase)